MRCAHVARIHKFDARAGGGGVDHYHSQCWRGDVFAFLFEYIYASGMLLVISIRGRNRLCTHTLDP